MMCGGYLLVWEYKPSMLCDSVLDVQFSYSIIVELKMFRLPSNWRTFQDSRTVRNIFMAKSLLHRLHRRACAGVCAFVVVDVACKKQVSLNTRACGQVCMLSKL